MPKTTQDFWTKEEEDFLKNNSGYHNKELLVSNLDREWQNIQRKARILGVNLKRKDKKYTTNQSKAEILLEDNHIVYYWIGFFLADGCYSENNKRISLCSEDIDHIIQLQKLIKCNLQPYKQKYATLILYDAQHNPMIAQKFDIKPRKTKNPPNVEIYKSMDFDLFLSLLIGFIDGDGCMDLRSIKIECHASWINWFEMCYDRLSVIFESTSKPKINNRGYALYRINHSQILSKLKSHIKTNNLPVLNRKWHKVSDIPKPIKHRITPEHKKEAQELRNAGLTIKNIAVKLGISIARVNNCLYPFRGKNRKDVDRTESLWYSGPVNNTTN